MKISWLLFLVKYTRRSEDCWGGRIYFGGYIFLKSSPTYCYVLYLPIWLGRWQEPLLKMSPLSLSLFLMTFLLLNGHDFCVPPVWTSSHYTINDNSNSLLTKTTPLSQSVQPTYCHLRIKLWIKCVRKVPDIKAIYAFMVRCVLFSNSHF